MKIERVAIYKKTQKGEILNPVIVTKLGFAAAYKQAENIMKFNNVMYAEQCYNLAIAKLTMEIPENYEFLKGYFYDTCKLEGREFKFQVMLTEEEEQAIFVECINNIKDEAIRLRRANENAAAV